MSASNRGGEPREQCKEAKFVDDNSPKLIERVTSVMPIADELKSLGMLHGEKYEEIKAEKTNPAKMRKLFDSLNSAHEVKTAFYHLLEKHEPYLFKDLGGVSRKRKLDDPESPVPCKTPKKVIKAPAPKKVKKAPAPKKVKKAPAPKKVKKAPAPKKVKKAPPHKKVKKAPPHKKVKKAPAPKRVKKAPAPKKVKKAPPHKKVKKAPAPMKLIKVAPGKLRLIYK